LDISNRAELPVVNTSAGGWWKVDPRASDSSIYTSFSLNLRGFPVVNPRHQREIQTAHRRLLTTFFILDGTVDTGDHPAPVDLDTKKIQDILDRCPFLDFDFLFSGS
jgi:hypothetical protein